MHERNVFFPFLLPVRFSVRCEATPTLFRESLRINFSFPPRECYRTKTLLDDSRFVSKSITEISLHYPLLHVFFTYHSLSVSRSSVFQKVGITRKLDWRVWIAARREIFTTSRELAPPRHSSTRDLPFLLRWVGNLIQPRLILETF